MPGRFSGRSMVGLGFAVALAVAGAARADDLAKIATGFFAGELCSAVFVSGLEPERMFTELADAIPAVRLIGWGMDADMDRARQRVNVTLFGAARSEAAYRNGLGCRLLHGDDAPESWAPEDGAGGPALLPEIAGPELSNIANPALQEAVARAFAEPDEPPYRRTKAVVVVKDGRVVAERYAPGYGIRTPVKGFSVSKSVINALVGILVRQGRLSVAEPAPVTAWRRFGDLHAAITIDHLLRHTSGLAMGSSLSASFGSLFAPVNRMKFLERDMAGFAESVGLDNPPGTAWAYHDGNTEILSRVVRDAVGGRAEDVLAFARRELFGPLGMHRVTIEVDATGTPMGSSQIFATPRDWARFGLLYLNDGVVGGRRILPEGWVAYSTSPTAGAEVGMGAGFWVNRGDSKGAHDRTALGMPAEAFLARGMFGQYVIVVPSERLVVTRFGFSAQQGDIDGVARFVAEVIAATR